jgi:pimeloyl-ACP methyl ester carboxylesterase
VLQNGEFLLQYAELDNDALVMPNLIMSEDRTYATLKEDALKEVFYADCSAEDVEFAKSRFVSQATAPLATPVSTTEENFGSIPRVYISCLRDKAISPSIQEKFYRALPCEKLIFLDTGHSPFFSAPEELANHLLSI